MKTNKLLKRLCYFATMMSLAFGMVMSQTMTALAADTELFDKGAGLLEDLYFLVLVITTPLAALMTIILLLIMMVSDDKESASYKKWIKKIWIIWIIINCLGTITDFGTDFFANMGYKRTIGTDKATNIQTIVNTFIK